MKRPSALRLPPPKSQKAKPKDDDNTPLTELQTEAASAAAVPEDVEEVGGGSEDGRKTEEAQASKRPAAKVNKPKTKAKGEAKAAPAVPKAKAKAKGKAKAKAKAKAAATSPADPGSEAGSGCNLLSSYTASTCLSVTRSFQELAKFLAYTSISLRISME